MFVTVGRIIIQSNFCGMKDLAWYSLAQRRCICLLLKMLHSLSSVYVRDVRCALLSIMSNSLLRPLCLQTVLAVFLEKSWPLHWCHFLMPSHNSIKNVNWLVELSQEECTHITSTITSKKLRAKFGFPYTHISSVLILQTSLTCKRIPSYLYVLTYSTSSLSMVSGERWVLLKSTTVSSVLAEEFYVCPSQQSSSSRPCTDPSGHFWCTPWWLCHSEIFYRWQDSVKVIFFCLRRVYSLTMSFGVLRIHNTDIECDSIYTKARCYTVYVLTNLSIPICNLSTTLQWFNDLRRSDPHYTVGNWLLYIMGLHTGMRRTRLWFDLPSGERVFWSFRNLCHLPTADPVFYPPSFYIIQAVWLLGDAKRERHDKLQTIL